MAHINRIILLLISVYYALSMHAVPIERQAVLFSTEKITQVEQAAQVWIDKYVASLAYEDVQILANTIYLTYATSLLDVRLKEHTRELLFATWQLYKDVNAYEYKMIVACGVPNQVQKFQELSNAWIFIYRIWHACTEYIQQDTFKNRHSAFNNALVAFSDYTQTTINESAQYARADLDTDIAGADDLIQMSQRALTRTHQGISKLKLISNALEKIDQTLQMADILRRTGSHMMRFGVGLDNYKCTVVETVKMVSIIYYKQLYAWMQLHEIPVQYMMLMFDGQGIIAVEKRTESLQDPSNLAYTRTSA